MAIRDTHGKPRTESPRMKDVPRLETGRDPSEGRDEQGRFVAGNQHSVGQGWKAVIRKSLGKVAEGAEPDDIVRQSVQLYLGTLRSLPSDGPGVRALVAAQARHTAIATHYANLAASAGLASPDGLRFAEASRAHDKTAQSLSVASFDRAVREANAAKQSVSTVDMIRARALEPKKEPA